MLGVTDETVSLNLTMDEALVLFEFLARAGDSDRLELVDQAEQVALWKLEAALEPVLVQILQPDYRDQVAAARARLQHSAG